LGRGEGTPAEEDGIGFQSKKESATGMHCCPKCDSILVQPVDWHEQGDGDWIVELRCPECEWWSRNTHSQGEVDRYGAMLDEGDKELIEGLRAVIRANMKEEADRFAAALATDCILPEDFYADSGPA
jgi:hypothetical protein